MCMLYTFQKHCLVFLIFKVARYFKNEVFIIFCQYNYIQCNSNFRYAKFSFHLVMCVMLSELQLKDFNVIVNQHLKAFISSELMLQGQGLCAKWLEVLYMPMLPGLLFIFST